MFTLHLWSASCLQVWSTLLPKGFSHKFSPYLSRDWAQSFPSRTGTQRNTQVMLASDARLRSRFQLWINRIHSIKICFWFTFPLCLQGYAPGLDLLHEVIVFTVKHCIFVLPKKYKTKIFYKFGRKLIISSRNWTE